MRIAIDCRPLMSGKISGVEVYMLEMMKALFEADPKNEYVLWHNNFGAVDTSRWPTGFSHVTVKRTRIPNKILNLCLSALRWPKVDRLVGGKVDVLWVPDPRPAPVSAKCRKVVTFHDLSFEDFKHAFSLKSRLWHKVLRPRLEACEASTIIAVSEFTKGRLVDRYGVDPSRVKVVYEAASAPLHALPIPKAFEIIQHKYQLPDRYFLCLSTLEPRKNIKGVIEAYLSWQREAKREVGLVIAGQKYPEIFAAFHIKKHPDICVTGFVDEKDKALLYQHALAFLYPSFYEGFGLPILEAMQCGTPVVTSNVTAMPEVAGGAACLVNPNDPQTLKDALYTLFRDGVYRAELAKKGLKRAGEFSWKKAAEMLLKAFV
ncbi:MAG: glycosyltransferase family 1 protein [Candidatus Peregrinibacteria bacterium]